MAPLAGCSTHQGLWLHLTTSVIDGIVGSKNLAVLTELVKENPAEAEMLRGIGDNPSENPAENP